MVINISTLIVATIAVYCGAWLGGCNGMLVGLVLANSFSLVLSATFSRTFVDMPSVVKGGVSLVAIAALAVCAGSFSRIAMDRVLHMSVWSTCLSTAIGMALFSLLYFGGNIGSIRGVAAGRL
jgi:hypothetical protein